MIMGDFKSGRSGGFSRGGSSGGRSFGGGDRRGGGSRGGFGGGRSFGGDRGRGGFGRDRDSERRPLEMHDVICSKCGKNCQVPFKPTGDKPVFCSACFEANGGGSRDRRGSFNGGDRSSGGVSAEQFKQLNVKLDKILKVLENLEVISDEDDLDEVVEGSEEVAADAENEDSDGEDSDDSEVESEVKAK